MTDNEGEDMVGRQVKTLFDKLDQRRRMLGMTYSALSKRSGVSVPTLVRILSGSQSAASFAAVVAVANALGMDVEISQIARAERFREQQAKTKASRLIETLQGTSSLEEQGLDGDTIEDMKRRTVHELLAGSSRRLWGE
jgi:transcriptional regulator with XRE-family HTH domain